jgi:hypothetical protein
MIHKILGMLQIGLSLFWIYLMITLYYEYHYTNLLFGLTYPDWVLLVYVLLSLINLYFGFKLFKSDISIKKSYLIMALLIGIGNIINNSYYLF